MPIVKRECNDLVRDPPAWKRCIAAKYNNPAGAEMTTDEALSLIIALLTRRRPRESSCCGQKPYMPPPGYTGNWYPPRGGGGCG